MVGQQELKNKVNINTHFWHQILKWDVGSSEFSFVWLIDGITVGLTTKQMRRYNFDWPRPAESGDRGGCWSAWPLLSSPSAPGWGFYRRSPPNTP